MRKSLLRTAAIWSFLLAPMVLPTAEAMAVNIVINGGFEAPDIGSGTWGVYEIIPGWNTTSGPGIEIQDHAAGSPYEGQQFVELDSHSNIGSGSNSAMISQQLPTIAGQQYELTFAYSPRPGVASSSNWIDVYFNDVLLDSLTATGGSVTNWAVFSYTLTAVRPFSTLGFAASGTDDSLGGYIDAVSLEAKAVPEPATMFLLGSGLIGLVGLNRRRKA